VPPDYFQDIIFKLTSSDLPQRRPTLFAQVNTHPKHISSLISNHHHTNTHFYLKTNAKRKRTKNNQHGLHLLQSKTPGLRAKPATLSPPRQSHQKSRNRRLHSHVRPQLKQPKLVDVCLDGRLSQGPEAGQESVPWPGTRSTTGAHMEILPSRRRTQTGTGDRLGRHRPELPTKGHGTSQRQGQEAARRQEVAPQKPGIIGNNVSKFRYPFGLLGTSKDMVHPYW